MIVERGGAAAPPTTEIAGRTVVLHHGNPETEYAALRSGALVVDRSERARVRFAGPKAAATLTGLVTNDIVALEPGHGCYAAALTAKGKLVADLRVFRTADTLLVDTSARAAAGWLDIVRKYVNPRFAKWSDESEATGELGVFGVRAHHVIGEAIGHAGTTLGVLPPYAHVTMEGEHGSVTIARVPDLDVEGYALIGPLGALEALSRRVADAGATFGGLLAYEIARVEAGRPEWGLDVDDATLAQEANLEELHAISYTKGCYTGQETVARVHFRGHVNRHLRGLRLAGTDLPPPRTPLHDESGKSVGDVRTAVLSPRLGAIALAMVRREVPMGATISAQWDGGSATATVHPLPFTA